MLESVSAARTSEPNDPDSSGKFRGSGRRILVDIADQTFIAASPQAVAAVVAESRRWLQWWPDLRLELTRDRGLKGLQWILTGTITGTAEIYLEPWHDGTLVHCFLRLRLPAGSTRPERIANRRTLAWKRTVTALKDDLEAGRRPGADVGGSSPPPEQTS
jgi:hypothetical protein